ncbi:conjugal transfer protein TraL [Bartonella sp. DGB2]|uniref:nucleotide-binding protein n=1 Tax=Bartonella sp. DGB2 TaxID=3388426 RepID=UPI00398FCE84
MAKIHMILQGKGGVGKSMVAAILAQYKMEKNQTPLCIDTDPINATFEGYKALAVKRLEIMDADEINTRKFDTLVEMSVSSKNDVIIDNGASSFVPLSYYLINNKVPSLFKSMEHELIIHTVITGGQSLRDTINGFTQLVEQFPLETNFVVWLNPYWGAVENDGKPFYDMKAFISNRSRISAIVEIPTLKEETYGYDFSTILKKRLTFKEAIEKETLPIMTKQRLKIIKDTIFQQLERAMEL